jgi:hypothetical protein
MRRTTLIVDRMEASEDAFAELHARYRHICAEEGVEPMSQKALLAILKALALGEEIADRHGTLQ